MGYHTLAYRSTVLTKYTGCSTRLRVLALLASSRGRGVSRDDGAPSAWSPEEASPALGAYSYCGCSFPAAVAAFARPSSLCFASVRAVDAALAQRSSLTATRAALAE